MSNTVLRAELGMCPLETNRDVRKLKWQYKVRNMPKKRLPAIDGRAVWEKLTKELAGIRWDSVVDKAWKDIGENQGDMLSIEKFAEYKTEVKEKDRNKGKASAKKQGDRGRTLKYVRRVKRRYRNENVLARPKGLRENAETAISCRGFGPATKKKEAFQ